MVGNLYGAPLSSKEIFESAQEAYKSEKNKKALQLFMEFRNEFPKDKRADDALLYIGRIYKRMGKIDMAIESFNMILDLPEKSKRFKEASFNLARIYFKKKSYEQVILLLKPFEKVKDFDKQDFRLLCLLAKTKYELGKENNKQNKKEDAQRNFFESVNIYALLADNDITDKDRINDLIGMAKSLFYLERLAKENKNDISAQTYKKSVQDTLKLALAHNKDEKKERYLTEQLRIKL
jgi:tetratricopeptide (TPR) repeat protein